MFRKPGPGERPHHRTIAEYVAELGHPVAALDDTAEAPLPGSQGANGALTAVELRYRAGVEPGVPIVVLTERSSARMMDLAERARESLINYLLNLPRPPRAKTDHESWLTATITAVRELAAEPAGAPLVLAGVRYEAVAVEDGFCAAWAIDAGSVRVTVAGPCSALPELTLRRLPVR